MSWFPILAAITITAVTYLGIDNPSRAFTLLLYIAAALFVWFVAAAWKELRAPVGRMRMAQRGPRLS